MVLAFILALLLVVTVGATCAFTCAIARWNAIRGRQRPTTNTTQPPTPPV